MKSCAAVSKVLYLRFTSPTITPKLRLKAAERNVSLSDIEKSWKRGNSLIGISTQIILDPKTQAWKSQRMLADGDTCSRTDAAHSGHDPSSSIIIEHHLHFHSLNILPSRSESCCRYRIQSRVV